MRTVFSEGVHFSVDADANSAGGLGQAVVCELGTWELLLEKSVIDTLYQEFKSLENFDLLLQLVTL